MNGKPTSTQQSTGPKYGSFLIFADEFFYETVLEAPPAMTLRQTSSTEKLAFLPHNTLVESRVNTTNA